MSVPVLIVAIFFFGMGVYALALPARVLSFFGVDVTTVDGRNEVRAVYGGFGVAIGVLLFAAGGMPALRSGVFVSVAIGLLGMAAGRVAAAVLDGPPGFFPALFGAVEIAMAVVLLAGV